MNKLILFFLIVSFNQIIAQTNDKKLCACCTDNYSEFDFWVGNWTVYDVNGIVVGSNKITKLYDNCVLREEWSSSSGNNGTSNNYYNSTDNTWNQIWVDNSGFSLVLKGNFIDGKMILKSDILKGQNGNYYNQITWTPNNDGSVTQLWEYFKEDGSLIQEAFKGIYKKD
ncbi:hypothetical protein [Urechidicola croceus]|uniref:Uncharacterized protein n=1 Tax=Urechidicola croceus TaxID=1850246 RepID=A0A1D8P796_9FLAO|nr:hypothetical protein [Urechidicola croceus]AOW20460.1 hypothetical protein LPB138_07135 [Urechidicola croceus]